MKTRTKQLLTVVVIVLLAGVVYAGSAFAQDDATATPAPNMLQRMQERLGPEGWGQMIQRMTQRHGAEFTGQMMQRMAQQENCPCLDGESCESGMGQGMMQHGRNGMNGGMMSRGMGNQGAMRQGFNQQMGPRFWNSQPTAAPSATPTE